MNRMVMKEQSVESLVAFAFTLHLKAGDHTNSTLILYWYGLEMSFKGPHNFMVTALGHSLVLLRLTTFSDY